MLSQQEDVVSFLLLVPFKDALRLDITDTRLVRRKSLTLQGMPNCGLHWSPPLVSFWLLHWLLLTLYVVEIKRRTEDCTLSGFMLCQGILKE